MLQVDVVLLTSVTSRALDQPPQLRLSGFSSRKQWKGSAQLYHAMLQMLVLGLGRARRSGSFDPMHKIQKFKILPTNPRANTIMINEDRIIFSLTGNCIIILFRVLKYRTNSDSQSVTLLKQITSCCISIWFACVLLRWNRPWYVAPLILIIHFWFQHGSSEFHHQWL